MKRIFLLLLIFLAGQVCFSQTCKTLNCVEPYDLTSVFSRFVSVVTGQNFLAEKIGESLTKKAINKSICTGKIKVNLDSFSTRDLKAGRFKSLEITGNNVNIDGIYISYFDLKTLCDFNYISHDESENYYVKEDIPAVFKIEITEDDLNNTMNSSDYKRLIYDINNLGGMLNIFSITSTSVKLKSDKMYYIVKYALPFVKRTNEAVISYDICVDEGRIVLKNPELVNNHSSSELEYFANILNYINPLDFSAKILENKDAKFNIKNVKISDKKITVDGTMTVLKDKE